MVRDEGVVTCGGEFLLHQGHDPPRRLPPPVSAPPETCEDRALDGPALDEKGSKSRNQLDQNPNPRVLVRPIRRADSI